MIGFDTETLLIRPGLQAPPVVCLTVCYGGASALYSRHDAVAVWREMLAGNEVLSGANTAYDVACLTTSTDTMAQVIQAYDADRVADVLTRQKLLDIAQGCYRGMWDANGKWRSYGYSLQDVGARYGLEKDGEDPWRLRYGELWDVPTVAWPAAATEYALHDASVTAGVWHQQEVVRQQIATAWGGLDPLADEFRQSRAAFWLKLVSIYGIRTSPEQVRRFASRVRDDYDYLCQFLVDHGLMQVEIARKKPAVEAYIINHRLTGHFAGKISKKLLATCPDRLLSALGAPDLRGHPALPALERAGLVSVYKRDTKAATSRMILAMRELGKDPVLTKPKRDQTGATRGGGRIALDADTCKNADDPLLEAYAEVSALSKTLSTDIKFLETGAVAPIHTRFEELAKTGRTTSSSPNIQNLRRELGIRECFVPRAGNVLIDSDYGQLELYTLAQSCLWALGKSRLAEILNSGQDPHLVVACDHLGISYSEGRQRKADKEPILGKARDCGKIDNFGFPGGLGLEKLVLFARKTYKIYLTVEEARHRKQKWFDTLPEMPEYFAMIRGLESFPGSREFNVVQPWSGRLRGKDTYCSACNSFFQGLGADVAKLAGWLVMRECYAVPTSPLFGCRIVNFIHDQLLVEAPAERGHEACVRVGELMNEAGRIVCPDVPPTAEPIIAMRWSKEAKLERDKVSGRILAWDIDQTKLETESHVRDRYVD